MNVRSGPNWASIGVELAAIAALTAPAPQVDFAELACRVITAVAANIGSLEQLLARRSGSWEADLIRQIVDSTAGCDPDGLLRWRRAPIELQVDPEEVFIDLGFNELLGEALDVAERSWEAASTEQGRHDTEELVEAIEGLYLADRYCRRHSVVVTVYRPP